MDPRLPSLLRTAAEASSAITSLSLLANRAGLLTLDFGRMLGTLLAPARPATVRLGWGMQLLNGIGLAAGYAALFRRARPSLAAGMLVGLGHAALAAGGLELLRRVHPRANEAGLRHLTPTAYGPLTVPGLVGGHLIYGGLIGRGLSRAGW